MNSFSTRIANSLALAIFLLSSSVGTGEDTPAEKKANRRSLQFFETKIRPVLVKHCYKCHAADSEEIGGGLLLDSREVSQKGGESGAAVVPGDVDGSLLISAIEYRDFEMPPDAKLPDDVIRDFKRWITSGAADPRNGQATTNPVASPKQTRSTDLWSLKPVTNPDPPTADDWAAHDIDQFVWKRLSDEALKPVADAGTDAILRRTTLDLIGLPPSPEQQTKFRADASRDLDSAMRQTVEALLATPQFGERWGKHWLDAVRYAESAGNSRDVLMPWAWRYRDYVIDSFNADVPYDQFLTEQVAGDLLEAKSPEERDRLQIATGFLAIGSKSLNGGNLELDIPDDQIDVIGKAILGLTISCARCHDHKFDPIPTADYYGLVGIFRSTETLYGGSTRRPKNAADKLKVYLPLGEDADERATKLAKIEKEVAVVTKKEATIGKRVALLEKRLPKDWQAQYTILKQREAAIASTAKTSDQKLLSGREKNQLRQFAQFETAQKQQAQLKAQLDQLKNNSPQDVEFAIGVRDKPKVADSPIYLRGDKGKASNVVPRGFLSAVSLTNSISVDAKQSGRLQLAYWLTQPDHPLTSRVIVNRVWQHLFGRGLVESVDNFGANGTKPSHSELLDWLAQRFVHEHQWSIKSLIREIMLSRSYRLSTDFNETNYERDPSNIFIWRMSRRRLEAEPLRDSILMASGHLDLERPHGSAVMKMGEGEVGRGIKTEYLDEPFPHRTVYMPILRTKMPAFLKTFDHPEPSNPQGLRDSTNVPAQSLYLMNSPFVIEQAKFLANDVIAATADSDERLKTLWQRTLSRSPTGTEINRSLEFLAKTDDKLKNEQSDSSKRQTQSWAMLSQALFASAEFRYVD